MRSTKTVDNPASRAAFSGRIARPRKFENMKKIALIAIVLAALIRLDAQDLTQGITFTDGQRLTAAQLGQLVNLATINTTFYTTKVSQGAPVSGDVFLVYSASSGTFHKLTAQSLLYGNTGIIANQTPYSTVSDYSSFLFYDPTNLWLGQITKSNLASVISSGIVFSNLVLWTTNGSKVPVYPIAFSAGSTNNQLNILVFDTNGVPSYITASNFLAQIYDYQFTNRYENYVYRQMFLPWTLYSTNTTDFTNAWGTKTNFPITSLYLTNAFNPTNTTPQILPTDTIPYNSGGQQTNTTVTVGAIYSYLTNLNTLPAYSIARANFSGNVNQTRLSTSLFNTAQGLLNTTNSISTNSITAISFLANGGTIPTSPQVLSNTVFYAVAQVTNANYFRIWTNYNEATGRTNWVTVSSAPTGTPSVLLLTNYTSFNADAIQTVSGTSVLGGEYDICFRTPTPDALYYVSGACIHDGSGQTISLEIDSSQIVTTNKVRVSTVKSGGSGTTASGLVHVLIQPQ